MLGVKVAKSGDKSQNLATKVETRDLSRDSTQSIFGKTKIQYKTRQ